MGKYNDMWNTICGVKHSGRVGQIFRADVKNARGGREQGEEGEERGDGNCRPPSGSCNLQGASECGNWGNNTGHPAAHTQQISHAAQCRICRNYKKH